MTDQIVVIQPEVTVVSTGNTVSTADIINAVNSISDIVRDSDITGFATRDGVETLTNKTLTSPTLNGGTWTFPIASTPTQTAEGRPVWDSASDTLTIGYGPGRKTMVDTTTVQTVAGKTLYDCGEATGALTGTTPTLEPGVWTWTLTADSLLGDGLSNGQSCTLIFTPGSYSVTWPTSTILGSWPTSMSAGVNAAVLFKAGGVLFRSYAGAA